MIQKQQQIQIEIRKLEEKLLKLRNEESSSDRDRGQQEKDIRQKISLLKNKRMKSTHKLMPIQQVHQSLLLEITKSSLYKDKNWFGENIANHIMKDDFLQRYQFASQLFESIFCSMPSLVIQFYNNQRNYARYGTPAYSDSCDQEEEGEWYQLKGFNFELLNFITSVLEVLDVCI